MIETMVGRSARPDQTNGHEPFRTETATDRVPAAMLPSIISVCNFKGGAGKSTIAVNLACALHRATGKAGVLVDADRQATAATWAKAGLLPVKTVTRLLHEAKPEERYPGMLWVTHIKGLAASNPFVVIDLPPGLQYSIAAVTTVSDLIVIPVNPSGIDFHSTSGFIALIQKSRELRRSDRPACVIVPNRLDRRTTIAHKLSLYEQFGEPIAPAIGMRTAFAYAFDHGQWVGDYAPGSAAHREIDRLAQLVLDGACDTGG
ncbi:MAG: ParA family protein [Rhodospirillales bacterium]|nr:MAG: ParA family protein [Rhodospirillales bacterium]